MRIEDDINLRGSVKDCKVVLHGDTIEKLEGGNKESDDNKPCSFYNESVTLHKRICRELHSLYERKNHDYGDTFHEQFLEEGYPMLRIRLWDKFSRVKTLTKMGESNAAVKEESLRDTLMDLANYALMAVIELDRRK